jgi:cob(I)alamin adenosyltransferase
MVRINKIYTRTGDDGDTGLVDGSRVGKDSARVTAYGDVDELNAQLGKIQVLVEQQVLAKQSKLSELTKKITLIQNELFDIGGQLATPAGFNQYPVFSVSDELITRLENWIDQATDSLPPLTSFVLPGGSLINAELHIARTVCRRAERAVIRLNRSEPVEPKTIIYLNRLSDLLFAWSRWVSAQQSIPEVLWIPSHKREA